MLLGKQVKNTVRDENDDVQVQAVHSADDTVVMCRTSAQQSSVIRSFIAFLGEVSRADETPSSLGETLKMLLNNRRASA